MELGLLASAVEGYTAPASSVLVGFLLAMLSAVFNGTYSVLAKDGLKPADVDDTVFNLWACFGLSASGLVIAWFNGPFIWTPLGFLSGMLLSTTIAWAFVTVTMIGASVGTGVKCGAESLMSFSFGLLVDPSSTGVSNLPLALVGLCLLLASIGGIAYAGRPSGQSSDEEAGLLDGKQTRSSKAAWHFAGGLFFSVIAGSTGGLILAPMQFVPEHSRGIAYLPSLIVGVLIGAPIVAIIPHLYRREWIKLAPKRAALPGIAAGLCWNASTVLKMFAIGYIGYGLAYPIVQSSLFVSGLWGIFLFDEMKGGRNRALFWLSGAFLVVGASLLTLSK